uniref:V-type proton ATPase subunit F n=1 Tax=Strongyloides venezuelensis TaxID=75913 RepID=A0A0K0F590_STRVS
MVLIDPKERIVSVIGNEDTIVGFLLGGIGKIDKCNRKNFFIVEKDTKPSEVEEAFISFTERDDIAIILITQHVAESIRSVVDNYTKCIPTVLEIPSKEMPYDPSKDSILNRAQGILNVEEFM